MFPSRPKPKFLLDENVKRRLERFLSSKGYDAIAPKELSNGRLASLSKSEQRVLVTNDEDFANAELYDRNRMFSVVLLKIPQNEPEELINAFSRLLEEREEFEGFLIILEKDKAEAFRLPAWKEFKR